MNKKRSLTDIFTKFEEVILSYSIIFMAVILIGNVLSRTLLNRSWSFAEEIGQTLIIITTFVGIGYAARKTKHINMSAFLDILPRKFQKISMIIISGITSLTLFYLSYLAMQYTLRVKELGRVTPALRIPTYLITAVVFIGFLLGAIEYAKTLFINIKRKEVYVSSEKEDNSCVDISDITSL